MSSSEPNFRGEKSAESGEKVDRVEFLIDPNVGNSALLHHKIVEQVYDGNTDIDKAREAVEKHGYDAKSLEARGKEIREMVQGGIINDPELSRGLVFSDNYGVHGYVEHPDLSVGVAEQLVDQMRKLGQIIAQPKLNRETVTNILGQWGRVPMPREKIQSMIDKGEQKIAKRAKSVLQAIPKGPKRDQYQTAWNVLESEVY